MDEGVCGQNREMINFHFVPVGFSVTIMGLVEVPSGRISDAERQRS
jgi:hypothetical protein